MSTPTDLLNRGGDSTSTYEYSEYAWVEKTPTECIEELKTDFKDIEVGAVMEILDAIFNALIPIAWLPSYFGIDLDGTWGHFILGAITNS